ncbi:MAG TPA: hypothetical protein PKX72_12000, partial [Chitinophagales bacterium]|nr:hypothetical protein [Chitinophagales bacterium]
MEQQNRAAWYEKKWIVALLCIVFFPVGLYALWKNSEISKGWKIGVTVLIVLIVIASIGEKDGKSSSVNSNTTVSSSAETEVQKPKEWVTVYTFNGNGMKKSPAFDLSGADARIRYSYKAPGGLGMGIFSVYVVDEGDDITKTGGIPEVMT